MSFEDKSLNRRTSSLRGNDANFDDIVKNVMNEIPRLGFGFVSIGALTEPRVEWLVDEILPKGVFAFYSGAAKSGKSTNVMHLIKCLTTGEDFFGRKVKRCRVLYFCLEDHLGEVKAKFKHMLGNKPFPEDFLISKARSLSLPGDFEKISHDIIESKADVIVLDTFRRSHDKEENSSSEMAPIITPLRQLVNSLKITMIPIHHCGHEVACLDNPGDWLRGSSDFNAVWETLVGLKRYQSKTDCYVFHKYRTNLKFSYSTRQSDVFDDHIKDYPIKDLVLIEEEQAECLILGTLAGGPLSENKMIELLKGKLSRPRIESALQALEVSGKVRHEGKRRNALWLKV